MYNFYVMDVIKNFASASEKDKRIVEEFILHFWNKNRQKYLSNNSKIGGTDFNFIDELLDVDITDEAESRNLIWNLRPTLNLKNSLPCKVSTGTDAYAFDNFMNLHRIDFKISETSNSNRVFRYFDKRGNVFLGKLSDKGGEDCSFSLSKIAASFSMYTNNIDSKDDDLMFFVYDQNPLPIFGTNGKPLLLYKGFIHGSTALELIKERSKSHEGKASFTLTFPYTDFLKYGDAEYFEKNFTYLEEAYGIEKWFDMMKKNAYTRDELIANIVDLNKVDNDIMKFINLLK